MLAQFAYVGAQVGVWSFVIRYTQFNTPGTAEKVAANNLLITLCLFFAGRFVGTLLMSKFRPATLLGLFAAADLLLCATAAFAWIHSACPRHTQASSAEPYATVRGCARGNASLGMGIFLLAAQ